MTRSRHPDVSITLRETRRASRQLVASGFLVVANQKELPGQGRGIPRLGSQRREHGHFAITGWSCLHQSDRPFLSLHQQQILHEDHLPVTIPPVLPLTLARGGINASEYPIIQPIEKSVPGDDVRELGL